MGDIIYWKKYDESGIVIDAKTGEKYPMPGGWVCEDERVSKVMLWEATSENPKSGVSLSAVLYFKDKTVKRFEIKDVQLNDGSTDNLISQAEQYLLNLPK